MTYSKYLKESFYQYWDLPAYVDYPGYFTMYVDVAEQIAKIHYLFRTLGIVPGDKIAICSKNCTNWAVTFLAITTYGTVAVPLLHEFASDTIANVVKHSDSKMFFVSSRIWSKLDESEFEALKGVVTLDSFNVVKCPEGYSLSDFADWQDKAFESELFHFSQEKFLNGIYEYDDEELLIINYTSGTTSNPKGVMLPSRAVASNIDFAFEVMPALVPGDKVISILPLAHTYSMSFELLAEFCKGAYVHFLTKPLSIKYVMDSFAAVKPRVLIMVPLILEKIVMKGIYPVLEKKTVRILRSNPFTKYFVDRYIGKKLYQSLGGNLYEVIVGGAALNHEIDHLLHDMQFPYTVGYGMTECAPIICYEDWKNFKPGTCGKVVERMELKVNSINPEKIEGEIMVKGKNVMLGYYKNPEDTQTVMDQDGWLHTGDLGVIDSDGNIMVKGRCKTMILGASGQNIYPEEIEEKINMFATVAESLVVERNKKLCALIYPNMQHPEICVLTNHQQLVQFFSGIHKEINKKLSSFQQIAEIEVLEREFEKTPKKSIKRYLYR